MKHFSTRGVAVLALVFSTAAGAQTADQERPSEPESIETELDLIPVQPIDSPEQRSADEPPRQLEEMVVTAQKTEQTLQEVPVSVTAIDGGFIQASGSADLADVSLYVPNVRVDADDLGSPQVFIRGFGTNAFNPSFESSVGFVQDEINFGRPGYFTEAMFDVDSVEVLRGPQGTLYGRNTVGGAVKYVTSRLDPDAPTLNARVNVGSYNQLDQIVSGTGFLSQNPMTLHFGLGTAKQADRVIVTWPSGTVQELQALAANRTHPLREP